MTDLTPYPCLHRRSPRGHTRLRAILGAIAASFVLGVAATAATFLEPEEINIPALLPPPPADDSPAGRADLETVLQLQADRTPEQLERVTRVANQTVFTFAAPVLGAWFTAERLPRTAEIFKTVTAESYAVALQTKRYWTRVRPHLRDARVEPVPRRSRSDAYPSGHSSDAATWAVLLAELYPEHRAALEEQVRESMWCRVLGGSHFPSDVTAGQTLGVEIGRLMLTHPAMHAALAEIRAEIARAQAEIATPPPSS